MYLLAEDDRAPPRYFYVNSETDDADASTDAFKILRSADSGMGGDGGGSLSFQYLVQTAPRENEQGNDPNMSVDALGNLEKDRPLIRGDDNEGSEAGRVSEVGSGEVSLLALSRKIRVSVKEKSDRTAANDGAAWTTENDESITFAVEKVDIDELYLIMVGLSVVKFCFEVSEASHRDNKKFEELPMRIEKFLQILDDEKRFHENFEKLEMEYARDLLRAVMTSFYIENKIYQVVNGMETNDTQPSAAMNESKMLMNTSTVSRASIAPANKAANSIGQSLKNLLRFFIDKGNVDQC